MSKKTYSGEWCTCTDCKRVLWLEDGPTCPECLAKREEAQPEPQAETEKKGRKS